jgi:hypothetical protein
MQPNGVETVKHDMTVGRYDVVMDTGPGYETKRLEGAENMLDLLKTPIGETVVKTGADIVLRNMDFPGADELANRAMPQSPQGMEKAMDSLPSDAKAIVQSLLAERTQMQQAMQHLQLELKYKTQIEQGWMGVEMQKARLQTDTKAHDAVLKAQTTHDDMHVKAQTSIAVAEINNAGKLLDTHVKGKQDVDAREHELAVAKAAEKQNGSSNA